MKTKSKKAVLLAGVFTAGCLLCALLTLRPQRAETPLPATFALLTTQAGEAQPVHVITLPAKETLQTTWHGQQADQAAMRPQRFDLIDTQAPAVAAEQAR